MHKKLILEINKINYPNKKDNYSTTIRHSTQSPSQGWRVVSTSPLPPEELGAKIYDILLEAPDLEFLDLNLYSKELYNEYRMIHKDLLIKLLDQWKD